MTAEYPTVTAEEFDAAYERAAAALSAYIDARERVRLAEQTLAEVMLRNATARADDLRDRWQGALSDLDLLRCNHSADGFCPCTSRLGHSGDHDHPTETSLVV